MFLAQTESHSRDDQIISLQETIQKAQVKIAESKKTRANLAEAQKYHKKGVEDYLETERVVKGRIHKY